MSKKQKKRRRRGDCEYRVYGLSKPGPRPRYFPLGRFSSMKKVREMAKRTGYDYLEVEQECHFADGRSFNRVAFHCERKGTWSPHYGSMTCRRVRPTRTTKRRIRARTKR